MNESPPARRAARAKSLSHEDMELWRAVARTLKPLKAAKRHVAEIPKPADSPKPPPAAHGRIKKVHAPPPKPIEPRAPAAPRIQPIEDKIRRKLARGRLRADMKLDLHGMRQHEAHAALLGFIARARQRGARIVIVVTGKGRGSASSEEAHAHTGGILQRMVRHWLAAPELRGWVIGFDEADAAHGGSGALYVRIRRDREKAGGEA